MTEIIICEYCGNQFFRKSGRGSKPKYCSATCRRAADLKRKNAGTSGRTKYKKQCEKCLLCFETLTVGQKYCSNLCLNKMTELPRRYCAVCNKPFKPQGKKTMCCSAACGAAKGGNTLQKHDYKYPEGLTIKEKAAYRASVNRKIKQDTDPGYRLHNAIRNGVYQSLLGSKNGRPWESLVDFTKGDLVKHLEKQFHGGMTWENYGEWHVDHKIPTSAFNFTKPEHIDFKRCWSLKNLQPMWARENMSKNAKLTKPFQPSLLI